MKRLKFITIMMILAAFLFGGIPVSKADTILPGSFVTDASDRTVLNYIKYKTVSGKDDDYALYAKKTSTGIFVYCIDLSKKYDGGLTYTKTGKMDVGINYILKNRPRTSDPYKDFYITQMTVYFYQDWLNGNDYNLQESFKKLIVTGAKVENTNLDATTKEVCKAIYNLWLDAKHYKESYVEKKGFINVTTSSVTFKQVDGYYVSDKIKVSYGNLKGDIKKTLVNATPNTVVIKDTTDGSYIVKVPVTDIPVGSKVTFQLKFDGEYGEEYAYYYYANSDHQRLLYDRLEDVTKAVSAKIELTVGRTEKYPINISKTDVTQSKEVPGATLVLKNAAGAIVEQWVSTTESHKVTLYPGEYSLTETIAPEGYKLSTTTIYFKIDAAGKLYARVNNSYVLVEKINMINELIDLISIVKKDKVTDQYVPGAVLAVKDLNGNIVQEFTSNNSVYTLSLKPGEYTLEEKSAPEGYILSNEKVSFKVLDNGALQIKNSNGVYEDSVMIVFYNTPEQKVIVPPTGASGLIFTIAGITLLISGVAYVIKTTKEC